ncbi:MAG: glycosyltransferase [Hyphomicrobiaceae bacterium]|nr:glycosyltransferase [Hyphomicrobiaceae bacterium]
MPYGRSGQRRAPNDPVAEYEFLVGQLLDRNTLRQAIATAESWGVAPHEVLLARGWISERAYVEELAGHLGVSVLGRAPAETGQGAILLDGTAGTPGQIARRVALGEGAGEAILLACSADLQQQEPAERKDWRQRRAIAGLLRLSPALSAGTPTWSWQLLTAAVLAGLAAGAAATAPDVAYDVLVVLLTIAFLPVILLRLVVVALGLAQQHEPRSANRIPDADLPVYSVLIPMFRESQVLPDLVTAISALDYPTAKLDVLLVLESVDAETRRVAASLELPGFMRVIEVPDSQPRTKPKALNYALQFARGDYVVVYDAEDVPEPDQLRRAIAGFCDSRADTICLQGRLNVHNVRDGWLARHFALEYTVLFDVTLPGLARLGLPIPLGGTSNHLPRAVLDRWIGWDPFNVTEDADLGIRLARTCGRVEMLDSTTWEEAPVRFQVWLRQRTRWLKGWMQTYLVHTRQPRRLLRDLGPVAFAGFHLYSGGLLLSALVFPVFFGMAVLELIGGDWLTPPDLLPGRVLWTLAAFNIAAAYAASVLAAVVAVRRRGRAWLALGAPFAPVYWLLISVAAYRALFHLATAPHLWEKTEHRSRSRPMDG